MIRIVRRGLPGLESVREDLPHRPCAVLLLLAVGLVGLYLVFAGPSWQTEPAVYGRITGSGVRLRTIAGLASSKVIAQLVHGEQVCIVQASRGWYRIRAPSGDVGWIWSPYVDVADADPRAGSIPAYEGVIARISTPLFEPQSLRVSGEVSGGERLVLARETADQACLCIVWRADGSRGGILRDALKGGENPRR